MISLDLDGKCINLIQRALRLEIEFQKPISGLYLHTFSVRFVWNASWGPFV